MKKIILAVLALLLFASAAYASSVDVNQTHYEFYAQPQHLVKMNTWASTYQGVVICGPQSIDLWCVKRNINGA